MATITLDSKEVEQAIVTYVKTRFGTSEDNLKVEKFVRSRNSSGTEPANDLNVAVEVLVNPISEAGITSLSQAIKEMPSTMLLGGAKPLSFDEEVAHLEAVKHHEEEKTEVSEVSTDDEEEPLELSTELSMSAEKTPINSLFANNGVD